MTGRWGVYGELWAYMREHRKFWLLPLILVLLFVGTFIALAQGTVLAPFLYAIF